MATFRPPSIAMMGVTSILLVQTVNLTNPFTAPQHQFVSLEAGLPALATPQYLPRRGDVPQRTQGTGSRGCSDSPLVSLTLLAPYNDIGATASGHPTLYWYFSDPVSMPVEVALTQSDQAAPIFIQRIDNPTAGVMQVQMPQDLPELVPGQQYTWSVAVICNPVRRSGDLVAQALIERVAPSAALESQLATTTTDLEKAEIFAQNGFWYDSLAALTAAYVAAPADRTVVEDWLSLLEQGGLTEVAAQERQRVEPDSLSRNN